ncbi:acetyl-CoA synthetase-like protein [Amniculicola lignicola CBS 123094]|uniref:Acetyl-CoA synthetase-like protein n=1 Tax=Amniculicola lignicola CBS 123094 TaxID=1392246 RepID=A0A6A5WFA5_9PLEO|nr:acetyl-CoA synthetase-like protein [Amniculicola lignicola CBS 123094]
MGSMPQVDNKGLLIKVIEEKALWSPDHTFLRYPSEDWEKDGYRTITWGQYSDAINKLAYWLDEQFGPVSSDNTVGYFGPNDARYALLLPAVMKTGRKLLVPDGRVTPEGLESLINATKCVGWLGKDPVSTKGTTNSKHCPLPSLQWCLDIGNSQRAYSYTKSWDEAKFDTIIIIHTSGTTGIPKPIYVTNGFFAPYFNMKTFIRNHWPRTIAYETWFGHSLLTSCPPQWVAGLHSYIFAPVFFDIISIIPPADISGLPPPIFTKILQQNVVDGLCCPPFTIEQLYHDPSTNPLLKNLKSIQYLGAALNQEIGDNLCEYTKLTSIIGSTETGPQVDILPTDRKLWHTHDYLPEHGYRMVPVPHSGHLDDESDDLFELVYDRPADGQPNPYHSAFWNPQFKDTQTIETKELYAPIKDKDGRTRWVFKTRKDDLTKLSWLAKFHAQDIEAKIKAHPFVSHVFVGGEGRPTPVVIIEPKDGVLGKEGLTEEELLDKLYAEVVVKSNDGSVKELLIPRETVLCSVGDKRFKVNLKQLLLRGEVEKDYEVEIEEAYARLAAKGVGGNGA